MTVVGDARAEPAAQEIPVEARPGARALAEPTILLSLLAASLYYFGSYTHVRYSEVIGVPWTIPCTPHECITTGFEVASPVLALVAVLVWAWVHARRRWSRLLLGNVAYVSAGALLLLYGAGLLLDGTVGPFMLLLGGVGVAAGAAGLLAAYRRVRTGRTWVEEAARRDWKAWAVGLTALLLAQGLAVEFIVTDLTERTYSGDLEGTPLDASVPAVLVMKDKASPLHGRELQILGQAEGKLYAYDFHEACPSIGHTTESSLCLYVVMESEVELMEFPRVWT